MRPFSFSSDAVNTRRPQPALASVESRQIARQSGYSCSSRSAAAQPLFQLPLMAALTVMFAFCAIFLKSLFTLSPLDFSGMLLLVVFALLAWPALSLAYRAQEKLLRRYKPRHSRTRKA